MKQRALFGAGAVALGVAAASLLGPQAASAIAFTFSFGSPSSGVSGLIEGLVEGPNSCDGTQPSCQVFVLDAGGTGAPAGQDEPYTKIGGAGFEVSQGVITSADWRGNRGDPEVTSGFVQLFFGIRNFAVLAGTGGSRSTSAVIGSATFTRVPDAVPGPAPLLGAAAAFSASRRLKRRIKGNSNTVPTAPFA